eukprot:TRINITY_DN778499_c0_g1_i1.p1 TRINITY_DN778499_c0_g1~~TRINITY_DN778499_c0_g1_i1.p1  ORF type:complete len:109 (-),score=21.65 TRINITY_DN778499_c0_g1_i1:175-501(-)
MVCSKCEKKLARLVTPDVAKAGKSSGKGVPGRRSFGNEILSKRRDLRRAMKGPIKEDSKKMYRKCRICKGGCSLIGANYCQSCSYEKGICAMCGRKTADTRGYNMTKA